ncbi:hypothetical protein RRG08_035430 [Elysia crispata]|uniref:Uncharacterized protein n=1 Tax=Elysia crispata TaxID=231223 RepID=A0AAE0Y4H3_9GAST|nr:hypothetical protein RRG08_035430 [Elysia crispata]
MVSLTLPRAELSLVYDWPLMTSLWTRTRLSALPLGVSAEGMWSGVYEDSGRSRSRQIRSRFTLADTPMSAQILRDGDQNFIRDACIGTLQDKEGDNSAIYSLQPARRPEIYDNFPVKRKPGFRVTRQSMITPPTPDTYRFSVIRTDISVYRCQCACQPMSFSVSSLCRRWRQQTTETVYTSNSRVKALREGFMAA